MTIIVDPSHTFRLFATAYAQLEPLIPVTEEYHWQVITIIDDICVGRSIAAFARPEAATSRRPGAGPVCCEMMVEFLSMLRFAMAEQKATKIVPSRAAELLYNFDFDDEDFTQPIMRLQGDRDNAVLASTARYSQLFGAKVRMPLTELYDATSWNLTQDFHFD